MKNSILINLLILSSFVIYSSSTLVDGIITMSWSLNEPPAIVDRFLTNKTEIELKILCRQPALNTTVTRKQIKKKLYNLDQTIKDTKIIIHGRIGRITNCLPLQSDTSIDSTQNDKKSQENFWLMFYEQLWKGMEQRTFTAQQSDCDYSGTHLYINEYSDIKKPDILITQSRQFEENQIQLNRNKNSSPLINSIH